VANKAQRYFVTGVSMITSFGSFGNNVMVAEWMMQVSYDPVLIAVFLHEGSVTLKNIREKKEFGVNVASDEQTNLVNIAGGYSRSEIDKLKVRHSFTFLKSKFIKAPTISGCVINAECKLFSIKKTGDHVMVIGKVVAMKFDETKKPLLYHGGRYYRLGSLIDPIRQKIKVNEFTFNWFSKESKGKFVLKCVGVIIRSDKKILVIRHFKNNMMYETIPYLFPKRGIDYFQSAQKHVKNIGLNVKLKQEPIMKRLILGNQSKIQRVNFVLFEAKQTKTSNKNKWKDKTEPLLKALID